MFFGTSVFLTAGSRLSAETREIFDPGESLDIFGDLAYLIEFKLFLNVWLTRSGTQDTNEMYRLNLRLQESGAYRTRRRWSVRISERGRLVTSTT